MKTIKYIITALLVIASLSESKGQSKQISGSGSVIHGILSEQNDTVRIGFANIALYRQSDSVLVTWTISKDDGSFELSGVPSGTFWLASSFIGYEKLTKSDIIVSKQGQTVELGKIILKPTTESLGEVTVVGVRKSVSSKIDRKVIDVSKDINSTGGTAVDLLRNVPGLSVSAEGAVTLRGSSDVSILIDGRPTSIDATKLDQISSAEVENIEIITNPTARYNPEGKSGIINLKLKQNRSKGLNGNAVISAGTGNKYNTGLNLSYNTGKLNFFASYYGMSRKTGSERYLFRESFEIDSAHFLQQNATTRLDLRSDKITLGGSINLNTKNTLTVSYTANPTTRTDRDSTLSQYFDASMNPNERIYTDNSETSKGNASDYILGYKKVFDKKGEELTLDYIYSTSSEKTDQLQVFNYTDHSESAEIFNNSMYKRSNLQLNWVLPLGVNSKLESGLQNIIRGTGIDYFKNILVGDAWIKDQSASNNFTYNEQLYSLYSSFSSKSDALTYVAGLRLEQTYVDGFQTINSEKISQNYFNLYPTLNAKYAMDDNNGIQIGYSRRINRPNARQLNPFTDISNPEVYRSGNPDLKPEYINSAEAGYYGSWKRSNAGFTLYYNHILNPINTITVLDSTGISHISPVNISSGRNYGFEMTYEQSLTKWWKISGNGSFFRNTLKSDAEGTSNSNYSYNARLNSVFSSKDKSSVQLVIIYTGPIISISSKMEPQFSVDLAIKRDFLAKKLSVTARVTDIFNTLKNSYTAWGNNFTADNWRKTETRVFYLSIAFNFGANPAQKSSRQNVNNESSHSTEIN